MRAHLIDTALSSAKTMPEYKVNKEGCKRGDGAKGAFKGISLGTPPSFKQETVAMDLFSCGKKPLLGRYSLPTFQKELIPGIHRNPKPPNVSRNLSFDGQESERKLSAKLNSVLQVIPDKPSSPLDRTSLWRPRPNVVDKETRGLVSKREIPCVAAEGYNGPMGENLDCEILPIVTSPSNVSEHFQLEQVLSEPSRISSLNRNQSSESSCSSVFGPDSRTCRICWVAEENEACVEPCHCTGSAAYVHLSCLQKWLQITNSFSCEVCRYQYQTERRMKPVRQWNWRLQKNRYLSQLEATLILLGVVTPPLVCGIILCSQKVSEYTTNSEHLWKTAVLMTLLLVSTCTYLAAVVYLCYKFAAVCKRWVASNQDVVVHLADLRTRKQTEQENSHNPALWTIT